MTPAHNWQSLAYGIRNALWRAAHDLEVSTSATDQRLAIALSHVGYAITELEDGLESGRITSLTFDEHLDPLSDDILATFVNFRKAQL